MKSNDLILASDAFCQGDLEFLLCALFACTPAELAFYRDTDLSPDQLATLDDWIKRLRQGEPPQYITTKAWFYGLEFSVNSSVLIPRFDTEVMVESLLKRLSADQSVLDIGTGSGCIPITLKKNLPTLRVYATDISAFALEVARQNALCHGVEVHFMLADLFPEADSRQYDLIVANPPYISRAEYSNLEDRVKLWEPQLALLAEDNGLVVFKRILERAQNYLLAGGILALEHGYEQREALVCLTKKWGFELLEYGSDLAQRDRYLILQKPMRNNG